MKDLGASLLVALFLAASPAAAQDEVPRGLFGSIEFRSSTLAAIPQWTSVLSRIEAEKELLAACGADAARCQTPRAVEWRHIVESLRGRPLLNQLEVLNRGVNALVPYVTDDVVYGLSDYWATPGEFLRNAGDCEDYAIVKFVSLLEVGVPNDTMRIVVVMDVVRNLAHAVLAVKIDNRSYILDSLIDAVVEDRFFTQYVPQYSVNLDSRWAHVAVPRTAGN